MYSIKPINFYVKEQTDSDFDIYAVQVRTGNVSAFDKIDQHIRPVVKRMSYKYEMNDYDREDLVQEMMLLALVLCLKYDSSKGHYVHYVYRSIRLRMYGYINNLGQEHFLNVSTSGLYLSDHKHALSRVLLKESVEYYSSALNDLSNYESSVWKLFVERRTFKEMAGILKRDEHSIINTIYRIKNKLDTIEHLHGNVDNDASSRYSILELK